MNMISNCSTCMLKMYVPSDQIDSKGFKLTLLAGYSCLQLLLLLFVYLHCTFTF